MMLPPPTTMPSATPKLLASATWRAIEATTRGSIPKPCSSPAKASPESLSRTLVYLGVIRSPSPTLSGLVSLPHSNAAEATYRDVLTHRGLRLLDEGGNRLCLVLDPLLLEENGVLEERLDLALDDLVYDSLRLARVLRRLGVDGRLLVDGRLRDLVARHPGGVRKRDVHGDVLRQPFEPLGLGDEIGLAVELQEHAELRRQVRVGLVLVGVHDAFGRCPPGPSGGVRKTPLPQDPLGGVDVAAGLLERLLAVHHPGAGRVAKGLHVSCAYLCHVLSLRSPRLPRLVQDLAAACSPGGAGSAAPPSEWHRRCRGCRSRPPRDRSWCRARRRSGPRACAPRAPRSPPCGYRGCRSRPVAGRGRGCPRDFAPASRTRA